MRGPHDVYAGLVPQELKLRAETRVEVDQFVPTIASVEAEFEFDNARVSNRTQHFLRDCRHLVIDEADAI